MEHERGVRDFDRERSGVAHHAHEMDRQVDFNDVRVQERESVWRRRIIKEALWTKKLEFSN